LPNIDTHLVQQGVTFQNSFVTNSQCCPSRATFLTGQYSHNHAVYSNIGNHPLKGGISWPGWLSTATQPGHSESTIATWLQDANYHTGYVGKYLNGYGSTAPEEISDPQVYVPPGWDEWYGLLDPSTYKVYDYLINQNGTVTSYGSAETDYQTDVLAGLATNFIQAAADNALPFFLVVTPLAPHLEVIDTLAALEGNEPRDGLDSTIRPATRHQHLIDGVADNGEMPDLHMKPSFNESDVSDKPSCPRPTPPTEIAVSFEPYCVADAPALRDTPDLANANKQYKSMLASMLAVDDLIGDIVTRLESDNLLSNTVIIFTSDNGWLSGEHRMIGKELAYEESIRIPLVVRSPGSAVFTQSSKIVLNNDLAPTIAALAGVVPPYEPDGASIMPLLADPADNNWHRRFFLVERWFVPSLFKFESPTLFAVRRLYEGQNYVFIASHTDTSDPATPTHHEFYELNSDPYQLQSLTLPQNALDILDNFLIYMRNCKGAQCRALEGI
jgi:arylsulfatase A-like enzyme